MIWKKGVMNGMNATWLRWRLSITKCCAKRSNHNWLIFLALSLFLCSTATTTIIPCLSGNDCTKHKCLAQGFDYSVEPWPTFTSSATVWAFTLEGSVNPNPIFFQIHAQEWNYENCVEGIQIPSPFQMQPALFCFCVCTLNPVCPFLCLCLRFQASPPFCVLLILLAVAKAPVVNKF